MEEWVSAYGVEPTCDGRRRCVLATSATIHICLLSKVMTDLLLHGGFFIKLVDNFVSSYGFESTCGGRRRFDLATTRATNATVQHILCFLSKVKKNLLRHEELFLQLMEKCVSSYGFQPSFGGRCRCYLATRATVHHRSSFKSYEGYVET